MRGNIDVFLTSETVSGSEARRIDPDLFRDYFRQLSDIAGSLNLLDPYGNVMSAVLMSSVLRLPDVVAVDKDELTEEDVEAITGALHEAVDALIAFRTREGAVLKADLLTRVDNIEAILAEAEVFEAERVPAVRQRIVSRMEELSLAPDHDRLEQEIPWTMRNVPAVNWVSSPRRWDARSIPWVPSPTMPECRNAWCG